MSSSLITFANLGKKENLRTTDVLPLIDTFYKAGILHQVMCQVNKGFYFKHTIPAIPTVLRYSIRIVEKLFRFSLSRRTMERLFDWCASQRLKDVDIVFLHAGHVLPRTIKKARARNMISVDITASAPLATNTELEKQEFAVLGLHNYTGHYMRLNKEISDGTMVDYIVAMSDFVKNEYIRWGFPADNIFIEPLDVDIKRFSPSGYTEKKDMPFRLLYLAYTQPLKGLHYLLDAWEAMRLPGAELMIVGGLADMPEELKERYSTRIKNNPHITWIPNAPKPEQYYAEASAFVFPSLTEGFGRVTIEAMACGLPVITTLHASGIVEEGVSGFVVPIRDAAALREKIEFLYHNPDKRIAMGNAARKAVENKKPFGEGMLDIYQKIMKKENRS